VFERFRQADASTTRHHGGLGLGLAIVRQITELHGGKVQAQSEGRGRGATFTVRLPVTRSAPQVTSMPHHAPGVGRSPAIVDLSGIKVLVVDDEPDTLDLMHTLLSSCGGRALVAGSALEALRLLKEEHPNVLVSDIGMPDIDGYELVRRVRGHSDPQVAGIAAIALTAFTLPQDVERAREAGFDSHIPKPVDTTALLEAVRSAGKRELVRS
jgi:diguanylate cyclase